MRALVVASSLILLLPVTSATTQGLPLQPGQRVRVSAPDLGMNKQAATFGALESGVITVTGDSTIRLALSELTRLDVYAGRRSNVNRGGLIGGLVGIGIGTTLSILWIANDCEVGDHHGCGGDEVALMGMGTLGGLGLVGTGLGAAIGAVIRTDKWEEIPLDRLRMSIVPTRRGFGLGARIAF